MSWASIAHRDDPPSGQGPKVVAAPRPPPPSASPASAPAAPHPQTLSAADRAHAVSAATIVLRYRPAPSAPSAAVDRVTRGLVNRHNSCFLNATVQSLFACDAFASLLSSLHSAHAAPPPSVAPVLRGLLDLYAQFNAAPAATPSSGASVHHLADPAPTPQSDSVPLPTSISVEPPRADSPAPTRAPTELKQQGSSPATDPAADTASDGEADGFEQVPAHRPSRSSRRRRQKAEVRAQHKDPKPAPARARPKPSTSARDASHSPLGADTRTNSAAAPSAPPSAPPQPTAPPTVPPTQSSSPSPAVRWRGDALFPSSLSAALGLFQKHNVGRQEDAQEFLSFLLNALHKEMLALVELARACTRLAELGALPAVTESSDFCEALADTEREATHGAEPDEEWLEIGSRNKQRVRNAEVKLEDTPISRVFAGKMRTVLAKKSSGIKDSVSFQPFYALPLDIADPAVGSVDAAVRQFLSSDAVEGFKAKSMREIKAVQRTELEALPPALLLHLKRFAFDEDGPIKIGKHIAFSEQLVIDSQAVFGATRPFAYSLTAVVVHHGARAAGGHYTAFVKRLVPAAAVVGPSAHSPARPLRADAKADTKGSKSSAKGPKTPPTVPSSSPAGPSPRDAQGPHWQWLHLDDHTVRAVPTETVLAQPAYLLLYAADSE